MYIINTVAVVSSERGATKNIIVVLNTQAEIGLRLGQVRSDKGGGMNGKTPAYIKMKVKYSKIIAFKTDTHRTEISTVFQDVLGRDPNFNFFTLEIQPDIKSWDDHCLIN